MTNSTGTLPKGASPTNSVAEHLRASFRKAQSRKTKDVAIPGYDELHVVFRALDDYSEVRDGIAKILSKRGIPESTREIEMGIQTLLMSSVDSYAMVAGEKVEIGLPLGVALYDYIWPAEDENEIRPQTDAEAVTMLFLSTMSLMTVTAELDMWFKNTGVETDNEVLGE